MSFSIGGGGLRMGPRGAIQNFGDSEEGGRDDGVACEAADVRLYERNGGLNHT